MRSREKIRADICNCAVDEEGVFITEVLLDCRELLLKLVAGKVKHVIQVKGKGKLDADDIKHITETVRKVQSEVEGE